MTTMRFEGKNYKVSAAVRRFMEEFYPKAVQTGDWSAVIAVFELGKASGEIVNA